MCKGTQSQLYYYRNAESVHKLLLYWLPIVSPNKLFGGDMSPVFSRFQQLCLLLFTCPGTEVFYCMAKYCTIALDRGPAAPQRRRCSPRAIRAANSASGSAVMRCDWPSNSQRNKQQPFGNTVRSLMDVCIMLLYRRPWLASRYRNQTCGPEGGTSSTVWKTHFSQIIPTIDAEVPYPSDCLHGLLTAQCFVCLFSTSPRWQLSEFLLVTVSFWRIRGNIIRIVLCCIVYHNAVLNYKHANHCGLRPC